MVSMQEGGYLSGTGTVNNTGTIAGPGYLSTSAINNESGGTINMNGPGTLELQSSGLVNKGNIDARYGGHLAVSEISNAEGGEMNISEGGRASLRGVSTTFTNNGSINVDGPGSAFKTFDGEYTSTNHRSNGITGSGDINLTNGGVFELVAGGSYFARVNNTINIDESSTLRSRGHDEQSSELNYLDGTLNNNGTIDVLKSLTIKGEVANYSEGKLIGGTWNVGTAASLKTIETGITENQANINLTGSGSQFKAIDRLTSNYGGFGIYEGRDYTTVSNWDNYGTLTVGESSTFTVPSAYDLNNYGQIDGSGTIVGTLLNCGTISPGNSPGSLFIDGDYFQNDFAKLLVEIAGYESQDYDYFSISGHAALAGELKVSLLDDFMPNVDGWTYDFMSFGAYEGHFDSYSGLTYSSWGYFDVLYNDTGISLVTHLTDLSNPSTVPTPSAFIMASLGLVASFRYLKRSNASNNRHR